MNVKIARLFWACLSLLIGFIRAEVSNPVQNDAIPTNAAALQRSVKISHTQTYAGVKSFSGTDSHVLFAVLNGTNCATTLSYGPSPIDLNGQVGGPNRAYLSTNTSHKDLLHTEWLQIVTSDGVNELFRIYWSFATPRTLEDHFTTAVSVGELVTFRIGREYRYYTSVFHTGKWDFSGKAGDMAAKFATTMTAAGFSDFGGQWGSGSPPRGKRLSYQYGVGTILWFTGSNGCDRVVRNGYIDQYDRTKTYLYYFNESGSSMISMYVNQRIDGVVYSTYLVDQSDYDRAFRAAIVASINGILSSDIKELQVLSWHDRPNHIGNDAARRRDTSLRSAVARGDSLYLQYHIFVYTNKRPNLYESMASDITHAVQSGDFNDRLNAQGVSAVPNSYIEIFPTNTPPDSPPKKKALFTVAAIIGISIGSCAGAALLLKCFAPCFCKKMMFKCIHPDEDFDNGEMHRNRNSRTGSDPNFFSSLSRRLTALREPEPVPTRAVLVAQLSASNYQEVAVADVQMVGADEEEECKE